jgi:hypothetical protein
MLARLVAQRFDKRMGSGRTWPCLLACDVGGDSDIEVVAKFSAGCDRGIGGLVAEALGAMLAADLDLPVPEPYLVVFDGDFVDTIPAEQAAVAERLRRSARIAFGSKKLPPGFSVFPSGKTVPVASRQQAAEIFAFDCLVANPDRRPNNPNLLYDGRSFAIFDHELAFMTEGIIGWQPPWAAGSLQISGHTHILFTALSGRAIDLSRLQGAWEALSDSRFAEYEAVLPPEWQDDNGVAAGILAYLHNVRDNIRPALAEVVRVLA